MESEHRCPNCGSVIASTLGPCSVCGWGRTGEEIATLRDEVARLTLALADSRAHARETESALEAMTVAHRKAVRERETLLAPKSARDRMFDSEAWDAAMDALGKVREERDAALRERDEALAEAQSERDDARNAARLCGDVESDRNAISARLGEATEMLREVEWIENEWEEEWCNFCGEERSAGHSHCRLAVFLAAGAQDGKGGRP